MKRQRLRPPVGAALPSLGRVPVIAYRRLQPGPAEDGPLDRYRLVTVRSESAPRYLLNEMPGRTICCWSWVHLWLRDRQLRGVLGVSFVEKARAAHDVPCDGSGA
jgi:hypothetical protein